VADLTLDQRRQRLARLMVGFGANVQPGQTVRVSADVGDRDLVRAVAAECYAAGARHVETNYVDVHLQRARIEFGGDDAIGFAPSWAFLQPRSAIDEGWATIALVGCGDPSVLAGLDQDRLGRDQSPVGREWLRAVAERATNWTVGPSPSPTWAAVAFPDLTPDEALERLWTETERVCRLDEDDPVASWEQRIDAVGQVTQRLTDSHFDALHFEGPGTDLEVGLLPSSRFVSGSATTASGILHHPNVPTEETFTTPDPGRVNGVVRATRPLDLGGTIINELRVRFEAGRAVEIAGDSGAEVLRTRAALDEGASRLGEVALVDGESRIGQLGTVFYETLYDENAACHIALGAAYDEAVGEDDRERINRSRLHIDFMIGSDDVDVTGVTASGERVPVLRGGKWQRGLASA
jgi:aminopeptidase